METEVLQIQIQQRDFLYIRDVVRRQVRVFAGATTVLRDHVAVQSPHGLFVLLDWETVTVSLPLGTFTSGAKWNDNKDSGAPLGIRTWKLTRGRMPNDWAQTMGCVNASIQAPVRRHPTWGRQARATHPPGE